MKKSSQFNPNKVTLAIYYAKPSYNIKIAEIRYHDCKLEIIVLDKTIEDDFKKAINKITKNQLQIPQHHIEKDKEGWRHYAEVKNVSQGDEDYLIGLYWAVLDSHVTIKGKYLLPRLLDENGNVIGRYGRKLKPLARPMKSAEEL